MTDARETVSAVIHEVAECLARVQPESLVAAADGIQAAARVFTAGAGRSGLMARAFAMRLSHLGIAAHVVGDPTTPAFGARDLLVVCSGSGRTGSLVSLAGRARELGGSAFLFTIDPASPLAALSHGMVVIPAPSPKLGGADAAGGSAAGRVSSIQPMGSLFEQVLLLALDALVLLLMERREMDSAQMYRRHANLE